jgi:radical SAM superfamily enzyme
VWQSARRRTGMEHMRRHSRVHRVEFTASCHCPELDGRAGRGEPVSLPLNNFFCTGSQQTVS